MGQKQIKLNSDTRWDAVQNNLKMFQLPKEELKKNDA